PHDPEPEVLEIDYLAQREADHLEPPARIDEPGEEIRARREEKKIVRRGKAELEREEQREEWSAPQGEDPRGADIAQAKQQGRRNAYEVDDPVVFRPGAEPGGKPRQQQRAEGPLRVVERDRQKRRRQRDEGG